MFSFIDHSNQIEIGYHNLPAHFKWNPWYLCSQQRPHFMYLLNVSETLDTFVAKKVTFHVPAQCQWNPWYPCSQKRSHFTYLLNVSETLDTLVANKGPHVTESDILNDCAAKIIKQTPSQVWQSETWQTWITYLGIQNRHPKHGKKCREIKPQSCRSKEAITPKNCTVHEKRFKIYHKLGTPITQHLINYNKQCFQTNWSHQTHK